MDSKEETYLHTGYEPIANDFKETSVEPYTEFLNSPPFFTDKGFPADAEHDDAALDAQQEELHCARAEEVQQRDQQLLQSRLLKQNLELRETHQKSFTEMEELKKFQSSTFDTIARRRLAED